MPVVRNYPDVFPGELPGMPLDRDVEFIIDLLPGTGPIAKRPYRMSVDQLAELKKQVDELIQCFALGIPCSVCQEEGRLNKNVH